MQSRSPGAGKWPTDSVSMASHFYAHELPIPGASSDVVVTSWRQTWYSQFEMASINFDDNTGSIRLASGAAILCSS